MGVSNLAGKRTESLNDIQMTFHGDLEGDFLLGQMNFVQILAKHLTEPPTEAGYSESWSLFLLGSGRGPRSHPTRHQCVAIQLHFYSVNNTEICNKHTA